MARREFFPCYHSYFKKCEKLTDQELGRLFRALMMYSSTGERQELAGRESIAFDFIADDIDRAEESYQEKCEKNAQNGKRGGRQKNQTLSEKANGSKKSERFKKNQTLSEKANGFKKSQYEDEDEYEDKEEDDILPPVSPPRGGESSPAQKDKPGKKAEEDWGFGTELTEAFRAWLRYKAEKRQPYKPEGLKALVTETRNNAERYGESSVAALIRKCMSANWQRIIWDRLPKMADEAKGTSGKDAWEYV